MQKQQKKIWLAVLILSLLSPQLWAAGKSFRIELLFFAQHSSTNEVFDQYNSRIEWPVRVAGLGQFNRAGYSLSGIKKRLQNSSAYRPLLHVAWTQRISANRLGTAVKIQDGATGINGFFRLQRGNLLHMLADFEYSPEGGVIYRIKEKRRFKLNEIHYLDHPRFGIIVRVSPL